MNDLSSTIYESAASQLIELVQAGPMTVATYMECSYLLGVLLRLNARTTDATTSQAGSLNSMLNAAMQAEEWAQSFTRNTEPPTQQSNTPLSHLGCWCNSSKKRDTNNA